MKILKPLLITTFVLVGFVKNSNSFEYQLDKDYKRVINIEHVIAAHPSRSIIKLESPINVNIFKKIIFKNFVSNPFSGESSLAECFKIRADRSRIEDSFEKKFGPYPDIISRYIDDAISFSCYKYVHMIIAGDVRIDNKLMSKEKEIESINKFNTLAVEELERLSFRNDDDKARLDEMKVLSMTLANYIAEALNLEDESKEKKDLQKMIVFRIISEIEYYQIDPNKFEDVKENIEYLYHNYWWNPNDYR